MPTREGDRHPRLNASEKAEGPEDAHFRDGLGKMITTTTILLVAELAVGNFFIFLLYFGDSRSADIMRAASLATSRIVCSMLRA